MGNSASNVSDITPRVVTLEGQQTANATLITALGARVDTIEPVVKTQGADVSSWKSSNATTLVSVANLESKFLELERQHAVTGATQTNLSGSYWNLSTTMDKLSSRFGAAETSVKTMWGYNADQRILSLSSNLSTNMVTATTRYNSLSATAVSLSTRVSALAVGVASVSAYAWNLTGFANNVSLSINTLNTQLSNLIASASSAQFNIESAFATATAGIDQRIKLVSDSFNATMLTQNGAMAALSARLYSAVLSVDARISELQKLAPPSPQVITVTSAMTVTPAMNGAFITTQTVPVTFLSTGYPVGFRVTVTNYSTVSAFLANGWVDTTTTAVSGMNGIFYRSPLSPSLTSIGFAGLGAVDFTFVSDKRFVVTYING